MDNRSVFAKNLRGQMKLHNKSRHEICDALGFSYYTFSDWVNGKKYPRIDKIEMLANYFGISKADLIEESSAFRGKSEAFPDTLFCLEAKHFPLLSNIVCGEPAFAGEQFEAYVSVGAAIDADFCLRAKGDSMIGARIFDGDIVFIHRQDRVEDGQVAAVLIDGEVTLKRVSFDRQAGVLQLFAENPQHKTLRFSGEELNRIRILGKAIAFQGDIQ